MVGGERGWPGWLSKVGIGFGAFERREYLLGGAVDSGAAADSRDAPFALVGRWARQRDLFWAMDSSCSKEQSGISCSMFRRSPLLNCTRRASLVSLSPGVRRMCPSHCHFRTLIAVTRSNV